MAQTNDGRSSATDIQKVLEDGDGSGTVVAEPDIRMAYQETINFYFNEWLSTQVDHSRESEKRFISVCVDCKTPRRH